MQGAGRRVRGCLLGTDYAQDAGHSLVEGGESVAAADRGAGAVVEGQVIQPCVRGVVVLFVCV